MRMHILAIKTIASAVDAVAERFPSRLALTYPLQSSAERRTYRQLSQTTNALDGWLLQH
jgi:acyl-CoA synthetase (AMP-forming)/AMP-acid ligase II